MPTEQMIVSIASLSDICQQLKTYSSLLQITTYLCCLRKLFTCVITWNENEDFT